jgi:hypothetical protein
MSQYDERVERQRLKLKAEEWASGVKSLHAHSVSSMWYDTRPQDTKDGKTVMDVEYNDGSVRRELQSGEIVILGKALKGNDLVDQFTRAGGN